MGERRTSQTLRECLTLPRIANSEGLRGTIAGKRLTIGDHGTSFGPFQLHYAGRGSLGNEYTPTTGHRANYLKYWQEQIDFALGYAGKNRTWAPWNGRHGAGVGTHQGFGYRHPTSVAPTPPPKRQTVVHTALHVDGRKMAGVVTRHQFDAANGPRRGASMADHSLLYPHV